MLIYHADPILECVLGAVNRRHFSIDENLALVRIVDSRQHVHQCCLTGTILPEECKNFTFPHAHGNMVIRRHAEKAFGDIPEFNCILLRQTAPPTAQMI